MIINNSNGHVNGQMTAGHNVTDTGTKLPRFNEKPDQNRQTTPEKASSVM